MSITSIAAINLCYSKSENAMTSISVKESTKRELLDVVSLLQTKYRRRVDFDEAIQYLLGQRRNKDPKLLLEACSEEESVDELLEELYKERRKDDERYQRFSSS